MKKANALMAMKCLRQKSLKTVFMKSLKNLGEVLTNKEQKSINGGFGRGPFLGSVCYPTIGRCSDALIAAINNGANPQTSSCVPCTTLWGAPGFMVEARV